MKRFIPILILACCLTTAAFAQYSAVNQALMLGGNGYVSVPYSMTLNYDITMSGQITIDAMVYPSSWSTSLMTIVGNTLGGSYWFGLTPSGKLRFQPNAATYWESATTVPTGNWSHVAVSFNALKNSLAFYRNGVKEVVTIGQSYFGTASSDLRIGADRSGQNPAYFWYGALDEVRIWKGEVDFSTASGKLWRVPHAVFNGLHGRQLAACWRLNGDFTQVESPNMDGSPVGTTNFVSTPTAVHYSQICALFANRQGATAPGADDYFTVPSAPGLEMVQNYTLECWVKRDTKYGNPTYQTFLSKGSALFNSFTYWLGLDVASGKVRFAPNGSMSTSMLSTGTLASGVWTHVAARYALVGGVRTGTIFINGVPSGTQTFTSDARGTSLPLLIGAADQQSSGYTGYGFSGSLDEVRIWNTARSDDEIADNHRFEFNGIVPGLSAMFHFDGDIMDRSGNGNNGTPRLPTYSEIWFADAADLPDPPTLAVTAPNGGETWTIGTTQSIKWTATGLVNVMIELSRDGGASWPEVLTPSTPASTGSWSWPVDGQPTTGALVRVSTPSPTSVSDASNAVFSIIEPPPVLAVAPKSFTFTASQNGPLPVEQMLRLTNTGGGTMGWQIATGGVLWLGLNPEAGFANIDSSGISVITTNMQPGTYNATLTITGNFSNSPVTVPVTYVVSASQYHSISGKVMGPAGPLQGIILGIDGDTSFTVVTQTDGSYFFGGLRYGNYSVTPVSPLYSFAPVNRLYTPLLSVQGNQDFVATEKAGSAMIRYRQGWNLISLPLIPTTPDLVSLFPDATSAFAYDQDSGYVARTTLAFGDGYWIKFRKADSVLVTGMLQGFLQRTLSHKAGGWNLIGVPAGPVPVASIMQSPPGSIASIYEYDPFFGYLPPTAGALRAGKAYFVRVTQTVSVSMNASAVFHFPEPWMSLRAFPSAVIVPSDRVPALPR